MNGISIIRTYIDRIIHGDGKLADGSMKALVLDSATTQIVSAVYSQTEILRQQVYLVTRLEETTSSAQNTKNNSHLKAVCFVRPNSLELLSNELRNNPRFAEYHVFVSGILTSGQVRSLASADSTHERIVQIQEFYADFIPLNQDLWTLHHTRSLAMTVAAGTSWAPKHAADYERTLTGIQSMLLALKREPVCIRYASHSPCAEELAKDLHDAIQSDDIFRFGHSAQRHGSSFQVLVLDRRDDPVTPLLSQWTYQAMVHELLGLNNHRVVLKGAPNISKDLHEVVLSSTQDDFFAKNRHKNFGELGEEIQRMLHDYQKQTAQHNPANLNTIEDMQNFMDKFPELRSQSHAVSKHVAIMGELARLVEVCSLMDVSQLEQELACAAEDHNGQWRLLMDKLASRDVKIPDKLRLGLLYALRYEVSGNIHMVQQAMSKGGVPQNMVDLLPVLLRYGGSKSRGPGLYGEEHNIMSKMTKSFMTSVQGVQNVYAQHVPLVMDTLQALFKGKLSTRTHPVVPGQQSLSPAGGGVATTVPEEVLVFMVGGVTYEEGTKIAEFNSSNGPRRVILAGSTVHNSTSFLEELRSTAL